MSRISRSLVLGVKFVCGVHLVNSSIFEISPTIGVSMYPTLSTEGDIVLTLQYKDMAKVQRGEVVTSLSPTNPQNFVCKRVVGLPGDTIHLPHPDPAQSEGDYLTVPKGHVWLAGDNTSNSTDSRDYGPVPMALLRGTVIGVVWPNPRWLPSNMTTVIPSSPTSTSET